MEVKTQWVPHMLTSNHQSQQMGAGLTLLSCYNEEGDQYLHQIIIVDENFLLYQISTLKQTSMSKKSKNKKAPQKFKEQLSTGEVIFIVFWNQQGILFLEYFRHCFAVNAETYLDILMELKVTIKRMRLGKLSKKRLLLHVKGGGVMDPGASNLHPISGVKIENAHPEITEFHLLNAVRGIHRSETTTFEIGLPVCF